VSADSRALGAEEDYERDWSGDGLDNDCDGVVDEECEENTCSAYGQSCESASDCCDDLPCTAGICRVPLG
jgi:hypothetical protein